LGQGFLTFKQEALKLLIRMLFVRQKLNVQDRQQERKPQVGYRSYTAAWVNKLWVRHIVKQDIYQVLVKHNVECNNREQTLPIKSL
jgi:hypothetical protein